MSDALVQDLLAQVQELRDREAIRELKARYLRLLDSQDWDALTPCFTPDAVFDLEGRDPIHGAAPFLDYARAFLRDARSLHDGHMPELTIDSPTEAHGLWMLSDYLEWPADAVTGERRGMKGYWRYEDRFSKADGTWRITALRLRARRIDPLPRQPLPDQVRSGPAELLEQP